MSESNRATMIERELNQSTGGDKGNKRFRQTTISDEEPTLDTTWGEEPPTIKEGCRLLFQNVNGISRYNDFSDVHEIGSAAEGLSVDVLGLAETNLDWQARGTRHDVQSRLQRYWKHSKIGVTSSDYRFDSVYQPGGTLLLVGQPWSGRASTTEDESGLGRWVETSLIGKLCAYQVVKNSVSRSGPFTAFTQQWHLLRLKGKQEPDPNKQFLKDLGKRVDDLIAAKHEVVIMMDANDMLQSPRSALSKWTREHKLIDVHVQRHGMEGEPPTHACGSNRIDYILTSSDISEFVTAAGILPLNEFCTSDHHAVYVDVALQEFLGGEPNPMVAASCRALQSNDPRAVKRYRELLEKYLDDSALEIRVESAVRRLKVTGYNAESPDSIEGLDREFTKARLECKAQCARIRSFPWSPILVKAKESVRYWKLWLSELRLKRSMAAQRDKLKQADRAPPSLGEANAALRTAQKELKAAI